MIKLNRNQINIVSGGVSPRSSSSSCFCIDKNHRVFPPSNSGSRCSARCCGGERGVIGYIENHKNKLCRDELARREGYKGTVHQNVLENYLLNMIDRNNIS